MSDIAERSYNLIRSYKDGNLYAPGAIHMTLEAARELADLLDETRRCVDPETIAALEAAGADTTSLREQGVEEHERVTRMRRTLSQVGTAGSLWGVPLVIDEDGLVDLWCTKEPPEEGETDGSNQAEPGS
jgi:hypothetical protein